MYSEEEVRRAMIHLIGELKPKMLDQIICHPSSGDFGHFVEVNLRQECRNFLKYSEPFTPSYVENSVVGRMKNYTWICKRPIDNEPWSESGDKNCSYFFDAEFTDRLAEMKILR